MGSFFDAILGTTVHAPDGTEGDAAAALTPYHEEVRRRDLMVRGLSGIGQAVIPPPSYDRVQVSPAAAMAMGPQGLQQTYARDMEREGMFNQRQQAGERNRLAEKQALMQATQQEKDRQAQLNYQQLQFRNSEKDRKLREDLAKSDADRREKEAEANRTWRDSDREDRQVDVAERMRIQQEAMLARQQASIAASRVGPPAVLLGVDKTGAKIYAHGGRTYAMLPDGTMEFRDAPGNAQLIYEKDEFGEATGNVYVVRTAPDGSQYQELLPKGPPTATGAPQGTAQGGVRTITQDQYNATKDAVKTGGPAAARNLYNIDSGIASGAIVISGATQPAQAPGAPAPQPVASPAEIPSVAPSAPVVPGAPMLTAAEIAAIQARNNAPSTAAPPVTGPVLDGLGRPIVPRITDSYGNPSAPRYLEPEDSDMPSRFRGGGAAPKRPTTQAPSVQQTAPKKDGTPQKLPNGSIARWDGEKWVEVL